MSEVTTDDILKWMRTTQTIIESLGQRPNNPPQPTQIVPPAHGNLTRCSVRFHGHHGENPEVFLAAINSYKTTNNIPDQDAIAALPVLLLDRAGSWWNTVKATTNTWALFQTNFRFAFGDNWTNSLVLQRWMQLQHDQGEPAELFISRCRDLLTHFSNEAAVSDILRIDFAFTKLHPNLRLRMNRSEVDSFDTLITKCRLIESAWREHGMMAPVVPVIPIQEFHHNHQSSYQQSHYQFQAHDRPVNAHIAPVNPTPPQPHFRCPAHKSDRHSWDNCYQNPAAAARKQNASYSHTNNRQSNPNAGYSHNNNNGYSNFNNNSQAQSSSSSPQMGNNFSSARPPQPSANFQQSRPSPQQPQQQRQQQQQSQTSAGQSVPRQQLYSPAPTSVLPQPSFVPSSSVICLKCGGAGHIASDCAYAGQPIRVKAEPTNMSAVHLSMSAVECIDSVDTCSIYFSSPPRAKRIYAMVLIGGILEVVLLDGGSNRSVISKRLFDSIRTLCPPSSRGKAVMRLANGLTVSTSYTKLITDVTIGGGELIRSFPLPLMYTEDDPFQTTTLGADFLQISNIDTNYTEDCWCFRDCPEQRFASVTDVDSSATLFKLSEEDAPALETSDREQLERLIQPFAGTFDEYGPPSTIGVHRIDTGDAEPTTTTPYPIPAKRRIKVQEMLGEMQDNGIIEPCDSAWSSPLLAVAKKDEIDSLRLCVDYRKVNKLTRPDRYPMPRLDQLLFRSGRRNFVSLLDLRTGFWQIPMAEEDRDKTAFTCEFGLFRYLRMPFGLQNAPATFQRAMDLFARTIPQVRLYAYLDDIIIISEDHDQHLRDLETVFRQLQKFNLRVNRKKCRFFCQRFKYLGHFVTPDGIETDESKVTAITEIPSPRTVKQVQSFVAACSWYRRFVPNFADIARPLTDLLKKNRPFKWTSAEEDSFSQLKTLLTSSPCLATSIEDKPFYLYTDASNYALGAVLCQGERDSCRPIEYASRLLIPAERNYCTTEREALAIVWALDRFRGYLECNEVIVMTDHQALRWLMSLKSPHGRLARWALQIQGYEAEIKYVPGHTNVVADLLSRPFLSDEMILEISAIEISFEPANIPSIREQQLADPESAKIIKAFECTPTIQTEIDRWCGRGFFMNQGLLYKFGSDDELEDPQIYTPRAMRKQILNDCHNSETSGHMGVRRTYARVAQRFYWPGMFKEIVDFVRCCTACQRYKSSNQPPSTVLQTPAPQRRFETLAIDLFGPLPVTPRGNRWILSVEDPATRYVEFFALPDGSADLCARTLVAEVFFRYGIPRKLISDNGAQFVSTIMQYTAHRFGIRQSMIPVHRPQANPVERKHRDLKPILAIAIQQNHTEWDEALPASRFAMNTAITQATGFSPAYLVFASELRTPYDINYDTRPISSTDDIQNEIAPYLEKLQDSLRCARETLALEQDRQKEIAEAGNREMKSFEPGDRVWVATYFLSHSAAGLTSKFYPKRDGPYIVTRQCSPTSYEVASAEQPEVVLGKYHASDLTACRGSNIGTQPVRPLARRGRPRKNRTPAVAPQDIAEGPAPAPHRRSPRLTDHV